MRVALIEMLHPGRRAGARADPARGGDRGGRGERQDLLRLRRAGRSSTGCWRRCCARCARMRTPMSRHQMSSVERLDELIARLERAAEQLRSGELSAGRGRDDGRGLRRACDAGRGELERRTRAEVSAPRRPGLGCCARPGLAAVARARDAPDTRSICASEVERYLEEMRFADEADHRGPGRGDALLAAGGRQAHPAGARARDRARGRAGAARGAAAGGGDRADPHLLADPRRPAGDGRRRAAPRARRPAMWRSARTSRSSPATACTRRRSAICSRASARRPSACSRRPPSWRARPASTAWSAGSTRTSARSAPAGPDGAAPAARAEDRPSDRRVGALRTTVGGDRRTCDNPVPSLRCGAGRAVPDR